jgi:two-component system sensor kinase FixL
VPICVRIHTTFAHELPNVLGDPVQIQQIILNLIANACDAMAQLPEENRRLMLATRLVEPNLAELSVADCGTGIAEDQLERIFEPFVTTKGTGLGLGLSICRTIATAHGGRLWAERLAVGARFRLTLPTESAQPAEERAT